MNAFILFGFINFLMALIINPLLRKEVINPSCPDDVKAVKVNKIGIRIYFTISVLLILIGIILIFV